MSTIGLAITFFFVANPLGMVPVILSLVKEYPFERQRRIVIRESIIAFFIALFFQFFGEYFLKMLNISSYALSLTGGTVLFLTAVKMIFHKPEEHVDASLKREPLIVPIATPMISGPGLMTMIMVNARAESNDLKIFTAITLAWIAVAAVMIGAPYLQKILGKRGLTALEQVMGMVIGLISIEMIVNGAHLFVKSLN